jgi:hypothetical protein
LLNIENIEIEPYPLVQEEPVWYELLAENFSVFYIMRFVYVVLVHMVLSLHNGWIDPRLFLYDTIRDFRDGIREI